MGNNNEYVSRIKTVCYNGSLIWKLDIEGENYPWHVLLYCKNCDFENLEDAKKAVDVFQELLRTKKINLGEIALAKLQYTETDI